MARKIKFDPADIVRPYDRPLPPQIEQGAKVYKIIREGVSLRVMVATPDHDDPRGTIIFHPGRTEFIEKYFESVCDFLDRGFVVMIFDPRGQGLSDRLLPDPLKSYVASFQDYVDDLVFLCEELAPDLPKPHILMGHSMGGCVVLHAAIAGLVNPAAIVTSAPMLGLFDVQTPVLEWFIRGMSMLGMSTRNLPFQKQERGKQLIFDGNKLTSDETRFMNWSDYFKTSPDLRVFGPTYGWVREAFKSMSFVMRNAEHLKIPGLVVVAGGDPIVDPESNIRFAMRAEIDHVIIRGAKHEVLMEQDKYRAKFFEAFDGFLDKQAL